MNAKITESSESSREKNEDIPSSFEEDLEDTGSDKFRNMMDGEIENESDL